MKRNRSQPASSQYERSLAAIKRIETHLKPEMDAWEDEKISRFRVMVFGEEAIEPTAGDPAASGAAIIDQKPDYEPQTP